jgi:hypothetical protein
MREGATPDVRHVVQRSVFDDEVFRDRQVGTCGDGPADL